MPTLFLVHNYIPPSINRSGLPKEPNNWAKTPPVTGGGKVTHAKGAINQFYVPEVLGRSPRVAQDHETARSLYSAMRVFVPFEIY
jgi:hypothetical protein